MFLRKSIDFDTGDPSCDLRELSKQICIFMHTNGFKRVSHRKASDYPGLPDGR